MIFRRISLRRLLCVLIFLLSIFLNDNAYGQISTFPYSQTFDTGSCVLPTGFSNSGSDPWSFQNINETYMDGLDHTSGSGCFASMDDSGGANDDSCLLTTPSIDLTSVPNARLKFWWQNSNATTSAPDNVGPRPWSNLYIDISTDSGSTWTRDVWAVEDSQQIGWTEAIVALDSFIGNKTKIRFRGLETQSFRSDMSLDDIFIYQPFPKDAALASILSPSALSCADSSAQVKIKVKNEGSDTIHSITFFYKIDTLSSVSQVVSTSIPPNASYVHTFNQTAILVTPGSHTLSTWLVLAADSVAANDTMVLSFKISPTISSFPYFADFETGQQGWEMSGINSSWDFGTPNKSIITGTTFGSNVFVNGGLTGTYNDNEVSQVSSPCFDFTNVSSQMKVGLDLWWETEVGYDGAALQYSTNGGGTWSNVGAYQDPNNWYNNNSVDAAPGGSLIGWSGTGSSGSGMWLYAKNDLPLSLLGSSNVMFRIAFASDISVVKDGFAFDNFNIFEPAAWDARVGGFTSPLEEICASNAEIVTAGIYNGGTDTITVLPVSYQVGNGPIFTDTIFTTLLPNTVYIHAFSQLANFSTPGSISLKSWTSLAFDSLTANDTFATTITVNASVSTFPYFQDFESGKQGWKEAGVNSSWAFGTPNKTIINSASSGINAFVNGGLTGTYNNTEISEVSSPCFDFTSSTAQYYMSSDIWWETTSIADGVAFQYTTNNGLTWTTIGQTGDPNNWYSYNFIASNPGGQQEGWTGTGVDGSGNWVNAKHILPLNLKNSNSVKFRFAFASGTAVSEGFAFDDFSIFLPDPWDASTTKLLSPRTVSCGDSMAIVGAEVQNEGSDTIKTLPISFQLNGGAIYTDTIHTVLAPTGSYTHNFSQSINLATVGTYNLKVWTTLAFDSVLTNDTLTTAIITSPSIASYPYYENFENGPQGWEISGVNATWTLGTPAKTTIQGAASGSNAFVNGGLTGSYNNFEVSNVNSPCFDLPVTNNDLWVALDIWYEIENTWDGAVLQFTVDSGSTWNNLGATNDPYNWFNFDTIYAKPGGQGVGWTGNNGTGSNNWVLAKHKLPDSLRGKQDVIFRVAFASDNVIKEDGMAFDNFAIVEYSKVNIDSHQTATCDTTPILLTASATSWGNYKWKNNVRNDSLYVSSTGTYWVQFTDTILNFSNYDTTFVRFFPAPQIQFTSFLDTIALSDSILLNPFVTGNVTYLWTPGNDTTSTLNVKGLIYGVGIHDFTLLVTDSNDCRDMDSVRVVVIDTSTGLAEFEYGNFKLFPNPVSDVLFIESAEHYYTVEVYNAQGQLMLLENASTSEHRLDMSDMEKGMYYVKISSNNLILNIHKVVKK